MEKIELKMLNDPIRVKLVVFSFLSAVVYKYLRFDMTIRKYHTTQIEISGAHMLSQSWLTGIFVFAWIFCLKLNAIFRSFFFSLAVVFYG